MTKRSFACLCVVASAIAADGFAENSSERQINRAYGKRLPELIQPSDATVTVLDVKDPPLRVQKPRTSLYTWLAQISDAIVLARVIRRESRLNDNSDWIQSDVHAVITDVVKAPAGTELKPGTQLSMVEEGGDLQIGDTRVRARVPDQRPSREGGAYLMFFNITDQTNPTVLNGFPKTYELTSNGRFLRLLRGQVDSNDPDEIENVLSSQAIAELRDAVDRR